MSEVTQQYIDQYHAASATLKGRGLPWLDEQRQAAIKVFENIGFPRQKDEDWRYTPLKSLTGKSLPINVGKEEPDLDVEQYLIAGLESHRLVFIDGQFSPQNSNVSGLDDLVVVDSFERVVSQSSPRNVDSVFTEVPLDHGFAALNIAFSKDGYVVDISNNTRIEKPIEIVFIAAERNLATQPRNVINIGKHCEAQIVERYISLSGTESLSNSTTSVTLEAGAKLGYYLVQMMQNDASQIATVDANQARDSVLQCFTLTLGGRVVRNSLRVGLNDEGAHCDMLGLYNTGGKQHIDNHTTVVHGAPHCSSRELYKGVLDQRSRAVFHGRIKVEEGAQKTDASQSNNNLLLSSSAEVDTKPQLEIYADDVKCAHGATVGQIDQNSLFYLRSRGIDEDSARALLTFAFLNEVLEGIELEPVKAVIESKLAERLIDDE